MDAITADPRLGRSLTAPSISAGRDNLYMRGEESHRMESRLLHKCLDLQCMEEC